ncbi:ATP-binding protein [Caulobacter sp.]|uniref:ATP-binding protein n=1 Tax=Caulobacter sp. TaxID=78 RepID=UPI001612F788
MTTRETLPVDVSAFFDVSLDLLVIRDVDGRVLKASRSWEAKMGHRPEDMEGQSLLRLVHPDDMPGTQMSAIEVENRRDGDPVRGYTNRYRHADGHYLTLEWRAQRYGDRIFGVARDVTERVAAERALLEAKASAEAANRAKTDFLANISHEIRTPLNGVIGIVDALARTSLSPDQAEMVDLIRNSGATLERLVSDFLDVAKIEAGQLRLEQRPFDLDEALRPCVEIMRHRAEEKGLTLQVECAGDLTHGHLGARYLGDGTRIGQVVGNLLSNAVKFTETGGVTLRIADEAAGLTLEIVDTGIGFDADHAAKLFGRFHQADASISRRFGGTGLGLSICHSLVEMMGGQIWATSSPGAGSRFVVILPLPRAPAEHPEIRDVNAPPLPRTDAPLRVLLVEDHPTNQRVAQLILAAQGAAVVTVGDGLDALDAFRVATFDVVLMDMQMPRMDGLAATRAMRAWETEIGASRTPIIMLSANALTTHREQTLAAGADLHVAKPITAANLLAGIQAAVG